MKGRHWVLLGFTLLAVSSVGLLPPIPQDLSYHHFADVRTLLGIPHGLNVLSNLAFVLVGLLGLRVLNKRQHSPLFPVLPYQFFFLGLLLTGLGSAYYHQAPSNQTLIWDRLPMTITFVSLFSALLAQLVNRKVGLALLFPLIILGIGSVLYWYWGEMHGSGDLRPYVLVQFYPMLAIPLTVFLYPASKSLRKSILGVILLYGLAKVLESADDSIFHWGRVISGHTLKHLAAAAAILPLISFLRKKELPLSNAV